MNRRNQYDRRDSLELGDTAQLVFKKVAISKGWKVTPASQNEDINEHWDYLLEKDGQSTKVDVKAMKRISRNDANIQDRYIWIELHGVRPYDEGWLYGGKADHFAFEIMTGFIIVKREDVIQLLERLVDFKIQVQHPAQAIYRIYQRQGRPDKLTLIETEKLKEIRYAFWKK